MTTKVTEFTRANCSQVEKGALEALAVYAESLGLTVTRDGTGTFARDGQWFQFKVRFIVGGEQGAENQERKNFAMLAYRYGLKEHHFGQEFRHSGRRYRLIGINGRARKNPFNIEDVETGQKYRTGVHIVSKVIEEYDAEHE